MVVKKLKKIKFNKSEDFLILFIPEHLYSGKMWFFLEPVIKNLQQEKINFVILPNYVTVQKDAKDKLLESLYAIIKEIKDAPNETKVNINKTG